jgi:hypothetical protein
MADKPKDADEPEKPKAGAEAPDEAKANGSKERNNLLTSVRVWQRVAAVAAVALVLVAAWQVWWPFREEPIPANDYSDPSSWQLLFSDRLMLGFVRLGMVALVIYLVASVPALIVGGRWLKGFGTGGVSTDDAEAANKTIAEYKAETKDLTEKLDTATAQADEFRAQRNEARSIISQLVKEQTSTQTKSG